MAKKSPPASHFDRGYGKAGWVYVARNDLHREDIYKVGYTEKTPQSRVAGLNTEQRNRTSQIGFFTLMYAAAVLDAQGCEQALFKRLDRVREHERKEFVNAPIEVIIGELLHIQKQDHAKVSATNVCPSCKAVVQFCPLPQITHTCPYCGGHFKSTHDGAVAAHRGTFVSKTHIASQEHFSMSRRSKLADAFLHLRGTIKGYCDDTLTDAEFWEAVSPWVEYDPPMDRSASPPMDTPQHKDLEFPCLGCNAVLILRYRPDANAIIRCPSCEGKYPWSAYAEREAKAKQAKAMFRRPSPYKPPKVRKGWVECNQCLSVFKEEDSCCPECGWRP